MAKFYYKYGTMNSSKTANLLMVAHNYESQGRRILCLKSALDTRWNTDGNSKEGLIESRAVPNPHKCELVSQTEDLYSLVKEYNNEIISRYSGEISAVLVDEAQFMTKEQIKQLSLVVERLNIDVLCFGLKNTYIDGEIFDGTAALMYYASSIEEIKTICKYCRRKATMNLRIVNGKAIYSGNNVAIGDVVDGAETYAQVCYHHYLNPPAPIIGMNSKGISKQGFADKFSHIIKFQNPYGYYRKVSEVQKQGFDYSLICPIHSKKDLKKLKYVSFGPIAIDLMEYSQVSYKTPIVNSITITEAIINFIYKFFEDTPNIAFDILKSSENRYFSIYENDSDYFKAKEKRKSSNRKDRKTPNGKYYYIDSHTSFSWSFWEAVLSGFSMRVNDIEVGFYYSENDTEG